MATNFDIDGLILFIANLAGWLFLIVRQPFKVGDRIQLIHTTDEMTKLEPGDQGIVTKIEGEAGDRLIWIKWDNGEKLALLEEIDKFKVVK